MEFELKASLRCLPVRVELADRVWRIPAYPASVWMLKILEGSWTTVVPGMLDPEQGKDFDVYMDDGLIMYEDCVRAGRDAVAAAAGCPWWSAVRLVHTASRSWEFVGGEMMRHGLVLEQMSFGAALTAMYRTIVVHLDKPKRAMFESSIDRTPAEISAEERYDPDKAADAFEAALRSRGRPDPD